MSAEAFAERRFRIGLALLTLAGAVGRYAYLVISKVDQGRVLDQGDAFWYGSTAWNLANGEVFRNYFSGGVTADHPPLTVLLLTPAAFFGEENTWGQRLTMVVLGALVITVVGLAGRSLAGRRVGLAAAAVAMVMPALWINDVLLMSETPAALLIAAVIWTGIVLARAPSLRLAAGAGALCGLAALTRAELGLLLPFMVWTTAVFARGVGWRPKLGLVLMSGAATAAVIAPWTLMNQSRFAEPVLISTNDGITLAGANCDDAYFGERKGGWVINPCVIDAYARLEAAKPPVPPGTPDACFDSLQAREPCLDASEVSIEMRREGLDYLRGHVADVPGVIAARNGRVWGLYRFDQSLDTGVDEGRPRLSTAVAFGFAWLMVPLGVGGLVLLRRRRESLIPFLAPLALVVLTTSAFTGLAPRYRLPWDVATCLLAGVALVHLMDRWAERRA